MTPTAEPARDVASPALHDRFVRIGGLACLVLFGFSAAGWVGRTLPRWISALGYGSAAAGLVSGLLVVSIYEGEGGTAWIDAATMSGLAWFLVSAAYLIVRGSAIREVPSEAGRG